MKKDNRKGFTLMEMLIVVAIIAVLVAIVIPTFSVSLTKAKKAADMENVYTAYAEASANYLSNLNEGKAVTSAMQADGELTINGVEFSWDEGETVTVIVDNEGLRQGD